MIIDRRKFVRLAGAGLAAAAATPATKLLAVDDQREAMKKAVAPTGTATTSGKPLTAKRWAMVIDTSKATRANVAKAIEACHSEHNVPRIGTEKEEIKWIWTEHFGHAFHEQDLHYLPESINHTPTLMLCNHCDNPPCTKVCPTEATWKREHDGIVMMDWHRCIGCRYCVVACPYGSRSFNFRDPRPHLEHTNAEYPTRMRGVVEKCTFCEERLAKGKMPACVDATAECGMITFGDLEDPHSNVSELLRSNFAIRRKPGIGTQPEVYYIVPRAEEHLRHDGVGAPEKGGHA